MSPDPEERDDAPFPDCPTCGDPVLFAVATGPTTGTVEPCGCAMPPTLLAGERDD